MIQMRRAHERGFFDHGWLKTFHTFSFGDYQDPNYMGFRHLRVMNEDRVAPGQGFGTHGHRDMEIFTYVLEGTLAHKDSMGHGAVLHPGEIQKMSAGTGIQHSEFNASHTEPVHFYQIWIIPNARGLQPDYQQITVAPASKENQLRLVASAGGGDGVVSWNQDVQLYLTHLDPRREVTHSLAPGRHAWVQVLTGAILLNGGSMRAGDGATVTEEAALHLTGLEPGELLLFDLA